MEEKKIKVLCYLDSPAIETGFAQVAKKILKALYDTGKYEFTIAGINHFGYYDQKVYPYVIHNTTPQDPLAQRTFVNLLQNSDFDILFTLNDIGVLNKFIPYINRARESKLFRWIVYTPVDCDGFPKDHTACLEECQVPIVYTNFAKNVIKEVNPELSEKLKVVYHGCDLETFKPLSKEEKLELRKKVGIAEDDFVVLNVNRNQWRKDLGRTMLGWKLWKDQTKTKTKLYLHCNPKDMGGNLEIQATQMGITDDNELYLSNVPACTREEMNIVYNLADLLVSTTLGEGWGLSTSEGFAAKVPVLMPNNTVNPEIIGENEERGYLMESGNDPNLIAISYGNSNFARAVTDIRSYMKKLSQVYDEIKNGKANEKVERAYEWAKQHTWDIICKEWVKVFEEAMAVKVKKKELKLNNSNQILKARMDGKIK